MLHSFLYAPGDRPELIRKALAGAADAVIVDLEDGVAPAARARARALAAETLGSQPAHERALPIAIRVDPAALVEGLQLAVQVRADAVYLPKAELASLRRCASTLTELESAAGSAAPTPVVALIETATGLLECAQLAASERVEGLALGESDLFADLGVDPQLPEDHRRSLRLPLVVASAAAGLRGPTAPASTNYRRLAEYRTSCEGLRRLGFAARSAVHPAQVAIINEVFAPGPEEIDRARALVDAFERAVADGRGVMIGEDGSMIDEAVVRSARRLLM